MDSGKKKFQIQDPKYKHLLYRLSQVLGLLLGAKVFVVLLLTFALYVSTFFLFNQEESFKAFVFDFKVHGIIFCTVLSILAGGIINQFYDREKDRIIKPFRSQIQNFLKQNYFLYTYLVLNTVSLGISWFISPRVFVYLIVYQFFMWFYSHKLSRILILNNLTFVALTLYPFFGMLVYYKTFSLKVFLMAIFLFLFLLIMDILKDTLTKNADKIFGYTPIPNFFGNKITRNVLIFLLLGLMGTSMLLVQQKGLHTVLSYFFAIGIFVIVVLVTLMANTFKNSNFYALNIMRIWIFLGILSMLLDGIYSKL